MEELVYATIEWKVVQQDWREDMYTTIEWGVVESDWRENNIFYDWMKSCATGLTGRFIHAKIDPRVVQI